MYKIIRNNNDVYCIIVYSISALNPLKNISDIEVALSRLNIESCFIIFDLLTSMGDTSQRYMEIEYKAGKFVTNTLKSISREKARNIIDLQNGYLMDAAISSDFSVLSRAGVTIQKKGVIS